MSSLSVQAERLIISALHQQQQRVRFATAAVCLRSTGPPRSLSHDPPRSYQSSAALSLSSPNPASTSSSTKTTRSVRPRRKRRNSKDVTPPSRSAPMRSIPDRFLPTFSNGDSGESSSSSFRLEDPVWLPPAYRGGRGDSSSSFKSRVGRGDGDGTSTTTLHSEIRSGGVSSPRGGSARRGVSPRQRARPGAAVEPNYHRRGRREGDDSNDNNNSWLARKPGDAAKKQITKSLKDDETVRQLRKPVQDIQSKLKRIVQTCKPWLSTSLDIPTVVTPTAEWAPASNEVEKFLTEAMELVDKLSNTLQQQVVPDHKKSKPMGLPNSSTSEDLLEALEDIIRVCLQLTHPVARHGRASSLLERDSSSPLSACALELVLACFRLGSVFEKIAHEEQRHQILRNEQQPKNEQNTLESSSSLTDWMSSFWNQMSSAPTAQQQSTSSALYSVENVSSLIRVDHQLYEAALTKLLARVPTTRLKSSNERLTHQKSFEENGRSGSGDTTTSLSVDRIAEHVSTLIYEGDPEHHIPTDFLRTLCSTGDQDCPPQSISQRQQNAVVKIQRIMLLYVRMESLAAAHHCRDLYSRISAFVETERATSVDPFLLVLRAYAAAASSQSGTTTEENQDCPTAKRSSAEDSEVAAREAIALLNERWNHSIPRSRIDRLAQASVVLSAVAATLRKLSSDSDETEKIRASFLSAADRLARRSLGNSAYHHIQKPSPTVFREQVPLVDALIRVYAQSDEHMPMAKTWLMTILPNNPMVVTGAQSDSSLESSKATKRQSKQSRSQSYSGLPNIRTINTVLGAIHARHLRTASMVPNEDLLFAMSLLEFTMTSGESSLRPNKETFDLIEAMLVSCCPPDVGELMEKWLSQKQLRALLSEGRLNVNLKLSNYHRVLWGWWMQAKLQPKGEADETVICCCERAWSLVEKMEVMSNPLLLSDKDVRAIKPITLYDLGTRPAKRTFEYILEICADTAVEEHLPMARRLANQTLQHCKAINLTLNPTTVERISHLVEKEEINDS